MDANKLAQMAPVEVVVKGSSGSGKTIVATLIQQMLAEKGFTSVIVNEPEQSAEERYAAVDAVFKENNPDFFCKSITISEETDPRRGCGG